MKTIAHYRKEHGKLHARVEQLERELGESAQQNAAARDALRTELATAKADVVRLTEQVVAGDLALTEREKALAAANERLNLLRDTITKLTTRVDEQRRQLETFRLDVEVLAAARDAWKEKAESAAPAVAAAEAKVAELVALLDKVNDRMRRKEREEAAAILNRKALAAAAPSVDRRRA